MRSLASLKSQRLASMRLYFAALLLLWPQRVDTSIAHVTMHKTPFAVDNIHQRQNFQYVKSGVHTGTLSDNTTGSSAYSSPAAYDPNPCGTPQCIAVLGRIATTVKKLVERNTQELSPTAVAVLRTLNAVAQRRDIGSFDHFRGRVPAMSKRPFLLPRDVFILRFEPTQRPTVASFAVWIGGSLAGISTPVSFIVPEGGCWVAHDIFGNAISGDHIFCANPLTGVVTVTIPSITSPNAPVFYLPVQHQLQPRAQKRKRWKADDDLASIFRKRGCNIASGLSPCTNTTHVDLLSTTRSLSAGEQLRLCMKPVAAPSESQVVSPNTQQPQQRQGNGSSDQWTGKYSWISFGAREKVAAVSCIVRPSLHASMELPPPIATIINASQLLTPQGTLEKDVSLLLCTRSACLVCVRCQC